jgi:hypothetical protein
VSECNDCGYIPLSPERLRLWDIVSVMKAALPKTKFYEDFNSKHLASCCGVCGIVEEHEDTISLDDAMGIIEKHKGCR